MKVVLKKSDAQEPYSFSFVSGAGKVVLKSENNEDKKSAVGGIESVRKNCTEDGRYELKEAKNGQQYFNLKAANGQVVGTSAMFGSDADRSAAIAELKADGPGAELDNQGA